MLIAHYFAAEQAAIEHTAASFEATSAKLAELEEEHTAEDGIFVDFDKLNQAEVKARLKEISKVKNAVEERAVLQQWLDLSAEESALKKALKEAEEALDTAAYNHYPKLEKGEIKSLVVDHKWLAALDVATHTEMNRVSQTLTQRVKQLAERYETPLSQLTQNVAQLEAKVAGHLQKMGFVWH